MLRWVLPANLDANRIAITRSGVDKGALTWSDVLIQPLELATWRRRRTRMSRNHSHEHERWKHDGVRVIKGDKLDSNTAQTPGMFRQAAINHARVGAQKIWAGTVGIQPNAKTGVHHHGAFESVIFVLRWPARMRWGEGTSSSFPPTFRIKRSTQIPINPSNVFSFVPTTRRCSSI